MKNHTVANSVSAYYTQFYEGKISYNAITRVINVLTKKEIYYMEQFSQFGNTPTKIKKSLTEYSSIGEKTWEYIAKGLKHYLKQSQ